MASVNRIDMSLDDIIKLNKKNTKGGNTAAAHGKGRGGINRRGASNSMAKGQQTGAGQSRGGARGRGTASRGRGQGRGGGVRQKGASYTIPNKLRRSQPGTQNNKFTGRRANAQVARKLVAARGQQAVKRARQTLRAAIQNRQKETKQQLLNRRRGIQSSSNQATTSGGRRKLVRPGFGVMQADIVAQQVLQNRKQAAFKQAVTNAKVHQSKYNQRRRLRRQAERRQQSAARNEPGHVLTVSVKNDIAQANPSRPAQAQNRRNQAVANRILKNTLQQPMRERRQQMRASNVSRGRGAARGRLGGNAGGQVRLLTQTINRLQQQVASLQQGNSQPLNRYQGGRGRRPNRGSFGPNRNNNARSRQNVQQQQPRLNLNPSRKVVW